MKRVFFLIAILCCIMTLKAQDYYVVTGDDVNVRSRSIDGKIVGKVCKLNSFIGRDLGNGWISFSIPPVSGVVSSQYVRKVSLLDFSPKMLGDYMGETSIPDVSYTLATLSLKEGYVLFKFTDYTVPDEDFGLRGMMSYVYAGVANKTGFTFTHLLYPYTENKSVTEQMTEIGPLEEPYEFVITEDGRIRSYDRVFEREESLTDNNRNIELSAGKKYKVEGTVGVGYQLQGTIMLNKLSKVMFDYVLNDGGEVETGTEYGVYDNGKMIFESGIEASLTDKIEGFWKEDRYGKTCLPLMLYIIGEEETDNRNVLLPPPAAPKLEDVLADYDSSVVKIKKQAEDVRVYGQIEQNPQFPGGLSACMDFLRRNIKYPEVSRKAGIQGKVIVQFVVRKDGRITDVTISKGVDYYLDTEAMRVVKSMPKWTPGRQKGKPVNVKYTLPITFRL